MKLKAFVADLNTVPEKFRELYEKTDDGYILTGVDDQDFKVKIGEFRNNNIEMKKKVDDLTAQMLKFKDIDPDKYKEAEELLRKLAEKELFEKGDIEGIVTGRVSDIAKKYEAQIQALTKRAEDGESAAGRYRSDLHAIRVENAVTKAVDSVAIPRQGALVDILSRARGVWKINDEDKLIAMSGDTPLYAEDGKTPLDLKGWVSGLVKEASYLFEPSKGGGSRPGSPQRPDHGTVIDRGAFSSRLEDIASGKVTVDAQL